MFLFCFFLICFVHIPKKYFFSACWHIHADSHQFRQILTVKDLTYFSIHPTIQKRKQLTKAVQTCFYQNI